MAQNITLWGASYSAVPSVTLPKTGGGTASFTDVTDTTASASDVATGKYFYTASGVRTQGTNSGGGGDSKNAQVVQGTTRTTSSTLTAIGAELTVSKTGTYDVYWSAFRSSTSSSYTYGTRLYVGGTAYGTENTTWSNHVQNNHLTGVSLTANQKIRVYGRNSRGSSYYIYAPTLVIIETS
jgi:hypothetical protein